MIDSTEGWAGGAAGFMMHYTGVDWVGEPTDPQNVINGLDMLSASSGWAVTHSTLEEGGKILRYNGTGLCTLRCPPSRRV